MSVDYYQCIVNSLDKEIQRPQYTFVCESIPEAVESEQVYQISMKLLANPEFIQLNDGQDNRYRAALSKYWDYCKALSGDVTVSTPIKNVPETEDEIKKNRIAFIAWAQSQQMPKAAILAYLLDIKKCSEFAQESYSDIEKVMQEAKAKMQMSKK